jgi:competence protein ComEA
MKLKQHLFTCLKIALLAMLGVAISIDIFFYAQATTTRAEEIKEIATHDIPTQAITVYISGAVKAPGVYELVYGSRIVELLERAKGITDQIEMLKFQESINLASVLKDGEHIFIPVLTSKAAASPHSSSFKISVNNATLAELMDLPGVGEVTAKAIIAGRPYAAIEDLLNIEGIGEKTFEQFKNDLSL